MGNTGKSRSRIHPGLPKGQAACCVAVPGTTAQSTALRGSATAAHPRTGSSISVFVWRELYPLTPDALYHPALLSPFVRTSTCSGRSKSRPPAVSGDFAAALTPCPLPPHSPTTPRQPGHKAVRPSVQMHSISAISSVFYRSFSNKMPVFHRCFRIGCGHPGRVPSGLQVNTRRIQGTRPEQIPAATPTPQNATLACNEVFVTV